MSGRIAFGAVPRFDGSQADGVHLLWTAPSETGYSVDGWYIQRRKATGRPKIECAELSSAQLQTLHEVLRLQTALAGFSMRIAPCPQSFSGGVTALSVAPGPCRAYGITLAEGHRYVRVSAGVAEMLGIALRHGKAVAATTTATPGGAQTLTFDGVDVDEVQLYCRSEAKSLGVCVDIAPTPDQDAALWANATVIAQGLQAPISTLDPTLTSQAAEDARAQSRLLPGEQFDPDQFHAVSEMMNAAVTAAAGAPPVWTTTVVRDELGDPFVDVAPWSYALALAIEPDWRRMLGFGLLDRAAELESGASYDYRITGHSRRRDVEQPLHGFQSVPRGTTLPTSFALGGLSFQTPAPALVALLPEPSDDELTETGRKGIALDGAGCLTLRLSSPVTEVSLELAPGAGLSWKAGTSEFLTSLLQQTFSGEVAGEQHVVIETAQPVDTIVFSGTAFLYGVRDPPVTPGASPDDIVAGSTTLYGVVFAATPPPDAPGFLDTAVLQEPSVPLDPANGPPPPPESIGFALSWPAPPSGPVVPWPTDINTYPPSDALGFRLERREVDTGSAYAPLDGSGTQTLVLGSRGSHPDPPALGPGMDLEVAFPVNPAPTAPVSPLIEYDDVLISSGTDGPPLGSTHQYRIVSVDAIGRESPAPREGPVVRLETHQPPPQPVGPPATSDDALPTAGIVARVLRAGDATLGPNDRALLGSSTNAVVVEWGWTDVERVAGPLAHEFRVYWQPLPPDVVNGTATGAAVAAGGLLEMPATLDRPIDADAMQGRYLTLGDYPFLVASHTAGQSITLSLEPSLLDPSRLPLPSGFDHRPVLTGTEQRPATWAERSAVVPLTEADAYQYVFRDRLVIDAEHPSSRVWVGVSCADDQSYVPDALPAAALNGGRPGNESAIAAAAASARYLGRPELMVPPPLPDVPELVTDEPSGDTVTVSLDLAALLPALSVPAGHQLLLERVSLDLIVACMSARDDGSIGVRFPDETTSSYIEASPVDQTALLGQIRSATPARVENRFLIDFLGRFQQKLETLWASATVPVALGPVTDTLPRKAERYAHRVRLSDAAGRISVGAAIVPLVVRVPSLRSPAPPTLDAPATDSDTLTVEVRVLDAFDLTSVVMFAAYTDANNPANGNVSTPARLLRLPNRRDLYPLDGLRLRLGDGKLLAPAAAVGTNTGTLEVPERVLTTTLTPGYGQRAALWAVALTRDGIPSRLTGPVQTLTGELPLVAPALTVTTADGVTTATWAALTVPALLSVERSSSGGASWSQVSPWLDAGVTEFAIPATAGTVSYRVSLRASRGRTVTGEAVPG